MTIRKHISVIQFGLFVVLFCWPGALQARIIRVDDSSTCPGSACEGGEGECDGSSWECAYPTLEEALQAATEGDEIWVARVDPEDENSPNGVYTPPYSGSCRCDANSCYESYEIPAGVSVYGGFLSTDHPQLPRGETCRDQRNPDPTNEETQTILSGEIVIAGNKDNICTIVTIGGEDAVLDGFVITGARAHGIEASGSPLLQNLWLKDNGALDVEGPEEPSDGAGIYVIGNGASPQILDCRFTGNEGFYGVGLYVRGTATATPSRPGLERCVFEDNFGIRGSGAYFEGTWTTPGFSCIASVTDCRFVGNKADTIGGAGAMVYHGADATFDRCEFRGNGSLDTGGRHENRARIFG